jgi:hypothetical protein
LGLPLLLLLLRAFVASKFEASLERFRSDDGNTLLPQLVLANKFEARLELVRTDDGNTLPQLVLANPAAREENNKAMKTVRNCIED